MFIWIDFVDMKFFINFSNVIIRIGYWDDSFVFYEYWKFLERSGKIVENIVILIFFFGKIIDLFFFG